MHDLVRYGLRSGNQILLKYVYEMPRRASEIAMLLSFVFWDIRKKHETGSTRYRALWDGRQRKALENLMQQRGVVKLTLPMSIKGMTWEGYLANAD